MKLAANLSLLYPGLPLAARAAAAARDGFRGVEILFPYDLKASDLAGLLQDHELELVLVNTPLGAAGEKGLASLPGRRAEFHSALHKALEVCTATGCHAIHVMTGVLPAEADRAIYVDTLVDNLRQAAALAADAGVVLTLEALNRRDAPNYLYWLPEQVAEVIQAVNHASVRMQFDFYHTQRENLDLDSALNELLGLVHHVQFAHPAQRNEPDLQDPAVASAIRRLHKSGYAGWVGCEYIPAGDTTTGLAWREAYQSLLNVA